MSTPKSSNVLAHLAVLGANIIYGITFSVAKDVMPEYLTPNAFILIRVTGAVLLFWLLAKVLGVNESIQKKDWSRVAAAGVFGVAINQLLFFQGLSLTSPINAAIIMTVNPVMVLIIAALVLSSPITRLKSAGIVLGISGAILLTTYRNGEWVMPNFSHETAFGDFLVFLNATSYAVYLVLIKPIMEKYNPVTVIKWVFSFGFVYVLPFGFMQLVETDFSHFPSLIFAEIGFVVFATTFLAYLFNIYGLKKLSPSVVSIYIYLQPFFATIVALLWGKDELSPIKILSASLIFLGVYLVSKRPKTSPEVIPGRS
jgi:drug/metabolite transporter (DMT)-like permease